MPTSYPGGLDAFRTDYDGLETADDVDHAGLHNDANAAVLAVQAELGTNPSGAAETVAQRLDALTARQLTAGTGLEGGGDNTADRAIWITTGGVGTTQLADGAATPVKTSGAYVADSVSRTLTAADSVVDVSTSSGAVVLTLPDASTMTGRALRILKTAGSGTLTIQRAGSDTIVPSSGTRTQVAFPTGAAMGELVLVSTGSAWHVVSGQASDESVGSRLWRWSQSIAAGSTTASVGWSLIAAYTGRRLLASWGTDGVIINHGGVTLTSITPRAAATGEIRVSRNMTSVTWEFRGFDAAATVGRITCAGFVHTPLTDLTGASGQVGSVAVMEFSGGVRALRSAQAALWFLFNTSIGSAASAFAVVPMTPSDVAWPASLPGIAA